MPATLARETEILFLAEAPGRHEDEQSGRPLTGPSGQLLRSLIPSGEEQFCSFDNTINCRPEGNRTPTWNEIECCHNRRVAVIERAKPKLIVGLGAVPLSWMLNSTDMVGMRGRPFAVKIGKHSCWFLPTYHPSFILRTAINKKKPIRSKFGHCLKMDIKKAFALLDGLKPPHIDTEAELRAGIQCFDGNNFDQLMQLLERVRKAPIKAIDIETKGLRPYASDAAIMSMAFSFVDTHFAFSWEHPKAKWSEQQKLKIGAVLFQLLTDNTIKVAHNSPFEIEWLIWLFGKDVVNHAAWECTQMQAHFICERRGKQGKEDDRRRATYQALDFLCRQYFGIGHKSLFKLNKKDMSKSDLAEILIYNAVDTKRTLKLYHVQSKLLKEHGLYDAYLEALPRQPTVALMQALGVSVDQAEVKKNQKLLGKEIAEIGGKIKELRVVKAFVADHGAFNPLSDKDALSIFKDYLKRPEVSEGGRLSVDKNVLSKIGHPLADLIVNLRNRSKLKSTYVDCLELGVGEAIYPDGKIHCNFNTTFAETGRTSSDEPNIQNFPQRNDAWIRKQIVAPKGHVLVAFDYGQLEGCTAAMCSKDKALVKALWEDYDIHQEWADKAAAKYKPLKEVKKLRSFIKNKLVFPAIFGAANSSIAGYLNVPEHIIDDLMDEFWATFHGLKLWQDKTMEQYYETGYVEGPTGRRHHYPLTRNQVINHPVQNFACDIVCNSMNRLSIMAAETGKWYLHPILNIHDDLTMCIPDKDEILEPAIETIYRTMLTPLYKEVNVPLSVKASIGQNWYEMTEIGQFWSHRDI